MTAISTVDDLNYPEKTETYYIVNAPYIFSACWKVCFLRLLQILTLFFSCKSSLTFHLILGREASVARENKEESSCVAWLRERRASTGNEDRLLFTWPLIFTLKASSGLKPLTITVQ